MFGHIAWNCTQEEGTNQGRRRFDMLQHGISLMQKHDIDEVICITWILLDSCSTDTAFKNLDLVNNRRRYSVDDELQMMINGRSVSYNKVTD